VAMGSCAVDIATYRSKTGALRGGGLALAMTSLLAGLGGGLGYGLEGNPAWIPFALGGTAGYAGGLAMGIRAKRLPAPSAACLEQAPDASLNGSLRYFRDHPESRPTPTR